jgi:SAM-dependent methyltransferase
MNREIDFSSQFQPNGFFRSGLFMTGSGGGSSVPPGNHDELKKRDTQIASVEPERRNPLLRTLIPEDESSPVATFTRLWNMFSVYTNETDFTVPVNRPTVVLSLACGVCDEAGVLNALLGYGMKLIGVDIDQDEIDDATTLNQIGGLLPPNMEFHQGDATNLDTIS